MILVYWGEKLFKSMQYNPEFWFRYWYAKGKQNILCSPKLSCQLGFKTTTLTRLLCKWNKKSEFNTPFIFKFIGLQKIFEISLAMSSLHNNILICSRVVIQGESIESRDWYKPLVDSVTCVYLHNPMLVRVRRHTSSHCQTVMWLEWLEEREWISKWHWHFQVNLFVASDGV